MSVRNLEYRVALMRESMELSWICLAIRLGLKKVTIEERYQIKKRCEFLHQRVKEMDKA